MNIIHDSTFEELILHLISTGREDDWWDFKEYHHADKAAMLHDILCMANNRGTHDGLIIFGVRDKTMEIMGSENDPHRRNQQNVVDFLRSVKFAGQIRPRVEVRSIQIQNHEIDIFIIRNSSDTPYYLTEDYRDKRYAADTGKNGKIVLAAHIYCRVMDNNTPIDGNADLIEIETLWKKRFGLLQTPLEQLSILLNEPKSWIEEEALYYHKQFPQFTIRVSWDADEDKEVVRSESPMFYHYVQTDSKAYYGMLRVFHYGTQLYSHQVTGLDGHRLCAPCPERGYIGQSITGDYKISYRYYEKDDIAYKLLRFLTYHYDEVYGHEASVVYRKLMSIVLLFSDSKERSQFEDYILQHNDAYKQLFSDDNYPEIISENPLERKSITDAIKTGRTLIKMQQMHEENPRDEETESWN